MYQLYRHGYPGSLDNGIAKPSSHVIKSQWGRQIGFDHTRENTETRREQYDTIPEEMLKLGNTKDKIIQRLFKMG